MEIVDTHCHIQSASRGSGKRITGNLWAKAPDLYSESMISNGQNADVTKMICVGCDLEDSKLAIEFAQDHPECFASVGIHPHEAKRYLQPPKATNESVSSDSLEQFAALVQESQTGAAHKVVAIGECGLDYFYNHSPKQAQAEVLRFQIELALEYKMPLIFHVREAFDDFWPIFDEFVAKGGKVSGVLHSFTDNMDNLEKALKHGLYLGVNGIATFTKNPKQLDVYKAIPLESLLLETDAPFLTPAPHRGTINEPKNTRVNAEFLARLKGVSLDEVAQQTTANARRLFRI